MLQLHVQSCVQLHGQGLDENNRLFLLYKVKGESGLREAALPFERKGIEKGTSDYYTW